ncbi:MAG: DUF3244 domain-containing protein [Bacteroides sp.]|nr:DUF3244 domain-containing protein [Bacteroides sp.]
MKYLVVILSALFLCSDLWAEERKVELYKNVEKPERSENSINLTAKSDGNIVTFYSEKNVQGLFVAVKTLTDEIITSEIISLVAGQTYTLSVGEIESDVYILEVKINGELYYGYLETY